ncbi:hypothetical protein [Sorangium cellulosum]|uniref:hypothetical protein n=1 Tax=Sorangium cellulosum TaxID=56 RepID=UPI001331BC1A|nr:hypothetical protein [Sorangium cellulosum]
MPERDVARQLAAAHRHADPATTTVKYFPSHAEVRLLEVSAAAPTTGEILPFQFEPDRANGVDYPSIVILLSPAEWARVENGSLPLPAGWDLDQAEDL